MWHQQAAKRFSTCLWHVRVDMGRGPSSISVGWSVHYSVSTAWSFSCRFCTTWQTVPAACRVCGLQRSPTCTCWSSRSLLQMGPTSSRSPVRQAHIGIDVVLLLHITIWARSSTCETPSAMCSGICMWGWAWQEGELGTSLLGFSCTLMRGTPLPSAQVWMNPVPHGVRRSAFGR